MSNAVRIAIQVRPAYMFLFICLTAMMNYKLLSLITMLSYEYVLFKSVKLVLYYELEKGNLIYLHLKNITLSIPIVSIMNCILKIFLYQSSKEQFLSHKIKHS